VLYGPWGRLRVNAGLSNPQLLVLPWRELKIARANGSNPTVVILGYKLNAFIQEKFVDLQVDGLNGTHEFGNPLGPGPFPAISHHSGANAGHFNRSAGLQKDHRGRLYISNDVLYDQYLRFAEIISHRYINWIKTCEDFAPEGWRAEVLKGITELDWKRLFVKPIQIDALDFRKTVAVASHD
jgi:hypothetical protein